MYTISGFGAMIADQVRMDAYSRALEKAISPGSIVFDIGAGTGIISLLACRLGARRVYAIDPNPAVQLIQEQARLNGFDGRIVVINDYSTNFSPDVAADVIVSDLRGILPFSEGHIEAIADARERLLAPGGVLIPKVDRLAAAIVSVPEEYARLIAPWERANRGFDMSPVRLVALNAWKKLRFAEDQLVTEAVVIATLDYRTVSREDARLKAVADWSVERRQVAHGIGAWFDTDLVEDVGFSNAPGMSEALYGRAFFPWETPLELHPGDRISATLEAWPIHDQYVWRWSTTVCRAGSLIAKFDQSTFKASPIDPGELTRSAASHVPVRVDAMEIDRFILDQIDGTISLGEMAERLVSRFPELVPTRQIALDHVARCTKRYRA